MKKNFAILLLLISIIAILLPLSFAEDIYVDITDDLGEAESQETTSESLYVNIKDISYLTSDATDLILLEPVPNEIARWSQNITLQNFNNESTVHVLNVWRDSNLSDEFLDEAEYISRYKSETFESNSFIIEIPALRSKLVEIEYTTPGINSSKNCFDQTVQDLLPSDAEVVVSDLSLSTVVSRICEFTLQSNHDYFKVKHWSSRNVWYL
jgi:hypothetical protein